jgi:hypothetical protein
MIEPYPGRTEALPGENAFGRGCRYRRSASIDGVARPRRFATHAAYESIKGTEVRPAAPLREERGRARRRELLGDRTRDELIGAYTLGPGKAFDLGLDRTRQTERVRAARALHGRILLSASDGASKPIPNLVALSPKPRALNATSQRVVAVRCRTVPAGEVIARDEDLGHSNPCAATIGTTRIDVRLPGMPPIQRSSTTSGSRQSSRRSALTDASVGK